MMAFPEYPIYSWFIVIWVGIAIITFLALFLITAPYGRHVRNGWGPQIPSRWGWIIIESTVLVVFSLFFFSGPEKASLNYFFLGLFFLHYINRSFIYPLRIKNTNRTMPLSIMLMAVIFNFGNGYLNGFWLGHVFPSYSMDWISDPRFIIGVGLFFSGMAINWHADEVLRKLRKPGETDYKIPEGGLYKWISCPNYFGECLEWLGWAIATWSLPGLSFAVWTAANLIPRAVANHKWYKEQFPDYPKDRKAVIPYVW